MNIDIGISKKSLDHLHTLLNNVLVQEFALYVKTLKFHWNVQGPSFHDRHLFFRELYEKTFDIIDDIAERVTTLGGKAFGTLQEFSENSTIKETPKKNPTDLVMIAELLADHELIIKQLRKDLDATQKLDDMGTNNFLTDIMEKHEKMAWMLRAHVIK